MTGVEVRRARDRFVVAETGRTSAHLFSFGPHYDPANVGFGPLVAHHDDRLAPGGGYPDHAHADVELVTVVLDGVLVHTDSSGDRAELGAGTVQVQSAGSGIVHSEMADGPTRFVQAWVRPDEPGTPPWRRTAPAPEGPALTAVDLPVGVAGARLYLARGDGPVTLTADPLQHLYLAEGRAEISGLSGPAGAAGAAGLRLDAGDSARITGMPGLELTLTGGSTLLVWSFRG